MKRFATLAVGLLLAPALCSAQQIGGFRINSNTMKGVGNAFNAATLTDEQVAAYARQGVKWMDENNPVAGPNDPYARRLAKIVEKHQEIDGLKINYKVYKVVDVNAFACADGSVRVFAGLMDIMDDDELLAIMGHEIGHVINHDSRDAMKSALNRSAIRNIAASQSGGVGQIARSEIGGFANAMVGASFSRKQESQADEYSYNYLKKNGYNVMALATSFEKLDKLSEGDTRSGTEKLMSSHPDSKDRAKKVRDRAKKDGLIK
jgi:metalloprotease